MLIVTLDWIDPVYNNNNNNNNNINNNNINNNTNINNNNNNFNKNMNKRLCSAKCYIRLDKSCLNISPAKPINALYTYIYT